MTELSEDEIAQILRWVERSSFGEFHLEIGDLKLTLRKGTVSSVPDSGSERGREETATAPHAGGTETAREASFPERAPEEDSAEAIPIKAPLLGTFYRSPWPGAPPFVEVGTVVSENDTVCILEMMKTMNKVKAGVSGRVAKVCVEDGQMVEYHQTLFLIDANKAGEKTPEDREEALHL